MTIKASGRSALILATGLFVCLAGPAQQAGAAAATKSETAVASVASHKYARHGSRHLKKYAHRKSDKVAAKPAGDNSADAADDGTRSSAIPASVANANAQLTSADTPTGNAARAMTASPGKPAADGQVVAADQLNDVDRALHETPPPSAPTLAMASAEAPAASAGAATASKNSPWDETSLIGKIFIGFGALLTMASAARMFMA